MHYYPPYSYKAALSFMKVDWITHSIDYSLEIFEDGACKPCTC